jgi:hypothetical protein
MSVRRLLHLVIIAVPFWFLLFPLFPPAVTAGVSWAQVTTWTLLTGVLELP